MATSGSTSVAAKDTERRARGRTTGPLAASYIMKLKSATPWRAGLSKEHCEGLGETENTGIAANEGSSLEPRLYLNIEFGINLIKYLSNLSKGRGG